MACTFEQRSRTYDVLESLEKQGFTIAKLGKPIKYIAVSPSVVVERLKINLMNEANEKSEILADIRDTEDYKQIANLYKTGITPVNSEDLSGLIKGRTNIFSHLKDIISGAQKEVILITNAEGLERKLKFLRPMLDSLKRKGVKMKIAVNATDEQMAKFKDLKADLSKTDINAKLCLVDKKHLLFMLSEKGDDDSWIWVNSPFFSEAMSSLVNSTLK
jgi:sugar-specific transcriptional regulator TrmB